MFELAAAGAWGVGMLWLLYPRWRRWRGRHWQGTAEYMSETWLQDQKRTPPTPQTMNDF